MTSDDQLALNMVGITKQFPGVLANDDIDFDVRRGEVHGLLGENGAGKTTLMNILYGLHHPDSGEISLNGEKVEITSPAAAVEHGIGMVHQHFMLVEPLTALENVVLGIPPERPPLLDLRPARKRFEQIAEAYNMDLDPNTEVWRLPVGKQQWLEILKQLFRNAQLLVLDEPTAVLAPAEAEQLFGTVRRLVDEGRSVIFISHKLGEVLEVTDRITVLRDGRVIGTVPTEEASRPELANMMVGRPVVLDRKPRETLKAQEPVLIIENLHCNNDRNLPAVKNLNLTVHSGEIVGIAGVDGNGQREFAECIGGLRKPTQGSIKIKGQIVDKVIDDPSLLGYTPEDRRKTGLLIDLNIEENLIIKDFKRHPYTKRGILQWNKIREHAKELIMSFDIRTPGPQVLVKRLSGGNQQRVVVARELGSQPDMVVASQPTRGLDLGAVEGVHEVLLEERNRGAAVLFISTELSEVLTLSDRIVVFFRGEIMGELDAEKADVNIVGEMMLGHPLEELSYDN